MSSRFVVPGGVIISLVLSGRGNRGAGRRLSAPPLASGALMSRG